MHIFPSFADSRTGCDQQQEIIADFIKQNYPPEEIRADFAFICCKTSIFAL